MDSRGICSYEVVRDRSHVDRQETNGLAALRSSRVAILELRFEVLRQAERHRVLLQCAEVSFACATEGFEVLVANVALGRKRVANRRTDLMANSLEWSEAAEQME